MEYQVKRISHYTDHWSARVVVVMNENGEEEVAAIVNCRSRLREQMNIEQVTEQKWAAVTEKERRFWNDLLEEMQ